MTVLYYRLLIFFSLLFPVQRKLNDSDYGNDLAAVEKEYENHQKEHKIIHQFHTNVDQCAVAEVCCSWISQMFFCHFLLVRRFLRVVICETTS